MINMIHTKILNRRLKKAEEALAEALTPFSPSVQAAITANPDLAEKMHEELKVSIADLLSRTWTKDDEFMANAAYIHSQM